MGNYEQLKQSVSDVIKTNGNQEITGSILQNVLLTIISTVGANATFSGIATPSTNPGTPDGSVFYLASESGTYSNFGSIELQDGLSVLMWNGSWSSQQIFGVDDVPTAGSDNLVKSGGVQEELALGAVYDVSAKNPTAGPNNDGKFESLSALLGDTNLNTLIPTSARKGGMSIKFIQSSDNKYVQYRYLIDSVTNDDFIKPSNWWKESAESIEHFLKPRRGLFRDGSVAYYGGNVDAAYWALDCFKQFSSTIYLRGVIVEVDVTGSQALQVVIINRSTVTIETIKELSLTDYKGYIPFIFDNPVEINPATDIVGFNCKYNGGNNVKFRYKLNCNDYGMREYTLSNDILSVGNVFTGAALNVQYIVDSEYLSAFAQQELAAIAQINSDINKTPTFYGPINGFFTNGNLSGTGRDSDYSNWWAPNVFHLSSGETITIKRIIALTNVGLFKIVKINTQSRISEDIFETTISSAGVHIIDIPDTELHENELIGFYVKLNGETPTCKFMYKANQPEEVAANNSLYEYYCDNSETPNQLNLLINYTGFKLCVQFHTQRDFTGNSLEQFFNQYLSKISEIEEQITPAPIPTFQALPAQLIYNVYVDVPSLKPYQSRNYQACVYLDHLLKGLTSEFDIRFDNKKDRIQKNIPIYCSDYGKLPSGGSYVAIEGNNYKEYSSNHVIKVNGVTDKLSFTLKNRCVKSSVGKSLVPKVLCIGDSITNGILSETKEDNFQYSNTYVDICRQLFWKDQIDNNTQNDYKYVMIGTHTRDKQFTYKGNTYSFKVFHEGYSGYSASNFLNGQVAAFKKSDNEPFSISAYISKYRTLDDNGNQLYFGPNQETTGTAGTNPGYWSNGQLAKDSQNNQIYLGTMVSNVESYSVCKPTHILINLGTNSPTSAEQWQQFVTLIHAEYPDIYIGLSIFDTSGTFFPSLHPKYSDSFAYWNQVAINPEVGASQNVSDHDKQWQTQNNLQTFFEKESERVYVVPFFYCTSTVESSVVREFESPIEELVKDTDLRNVVYGWGGNYHINALAHAQCAYQMYGWIKWTLIS